MSVALELPAIVAHWQTNCPVVDARRAYTDLGGPAFNRPVIPAAETIATGTVDATLSALVWIRLSLTGVSRSGRPMGIDPNSQTHREGLAVQQVFYPLGYGLKFVLAKLDLARAVFHRETLSSGLVRFRDSDAPVAIDIPDNDAAGWGQFNITTPYWVRETV